MSKEYLINGRVYCILPYEKLKLREERRVLGLLGISEDSNVGSIEIIANRPEELFPLLLKDNAGNPIVTEDVQELSVEQQFEIISETIMGRVRFLSQSGERSKELMKNAIGSNAS